MVKKKKVCFTALTGIVAFPHYLWPKMQVTLKYMKLSRPPSRKTPQKTWTVIKTLKITLFFVKEKCFNLLEYQKSFCLPKVRNSRKLHKFLSNHLPKNPGNFSDLLGSQYHTRMTFLHKHKANVSCPDKDLCWAGYSNFSLRQTNCVRVFPGLKMSLWALLCKHSKG